MAGTSETIRTHLTKRSVDALRIDLAGDYFAWDDELPGFGVRVRPSGHKAYVLRYRLGGRSGRQRRRNLGAHGVVTPDDARRHARSLLGTVARREDPHAATDRAQVAMRVAEAVEPYLRHVDAKKKPNTVREYRRLFKLHILPALGSLPLAEVTPAVVNRLHDKLSSNPVQANRVLARVSGFFSWCHDRNLIDEAVPNPCAKVEHYRERARERFLTVAEVGRLGAALSKAEREGLPQPKKRAKPWKDGPKAKHRPKKAGKPVPASPLAVAAIRLALLTGMRRGEVLGLKWTEIDKERAMLRLGDSKTGAKVVPIGAPALLVLDGLPRMADSPYVFASGDGQRPLESVRRTWDAVRRAAKLEDVRLHDLRHSFASFMAEQGESLLLIGSLLGHKHASTTQRYAHLVDDRRTAAADATAGRLAEVMGLASTTITDTAVTPLMGRRA